MFAWLFSLFRKKPDVSSFDVFQPSVRLIYSYWDGAKLVKADPHPLYIRVAAKGRELDANLRSARSVIDPKAAESHIAAMAIIRGIFDVKEFKDGGLTDMETLGLFEHFWDFCEALKKNSPEPPTSAGDQSPPTQPSPKPNSKGPSPTSNGSVSGSTGSVPSTVSPPPMPSAQPSPAAQPSPT